MASPFFIGRGAYQGFDNWRNRRKFSPNMPNGATWTGRQEPGVGLPLHDQDRTILADTILSAESFGTATWQSVVLADTIASAEAFGTPQANMTIYPDSGASDEAFGAVTVMLYVTADTIVSAEAFGTPIVTGPIIADTITSLEAFGVPIVAGPIVADTIASAEAFGTIRIGFDTVTPDVVPRLGGTPVELFVVGSGNGTFVVHVGEAGDETDPVCYAGLDRGGQVIIVEDNELSVVLPNLPTGGPYRFFLVRRSGTGDATVSTEPILTVLPDGFSGRTYGFRSLFPPRYAVGPREIAREEYPQ